MLAKSNWAHNPIDWAIGRGVTTGTSAAMFIPDVICTCAQIVTFL